MTRDQWIQQFATAIGMPVPDSETIERLLDLAAMAAHQSERTAAPIACDLAGLARCDVNVLADCASNIKG